MNVDSPQNIISLCSGYCGIELGLRMAGVDVREVAYVEREAFAAANLAAKIEQGKLAPAPVWTDVKTFPAEIFREKIHGIVGGYPCQPFSVAGQRKGTDDPRHLWPYIAKHVKTIKPVWCFFENVSGHLRLGFEEVLKSLRDMGYKVAAGLFTAAEVGAPHKRERLFILANSSRTTSGNQSRQIDRRARQKNVSQGNRQIGTIRAGATSELAIPGIQGLQKPPRRKLLSVQGQTEKSERGKPGRISTETKWPARPGKPQKDWEKPRTIESDVGCTIDGHNTRVDMLRLLGNGVVPQQAAKAWIMLTSQLI